MGGFRGIKIDLAGRNGTTTAFVRGLCMVVPELEIMPQIDVTTTTTTTTTLQQLWGVGFLSPPKSQVIFSMCSHYPVIMCYIIYFFFYSKRNNNLRGTGFLTCSHRKYLLDFQGVKNTGGGLLLSCGCRCCCGWCCRKTLYPFVDNHQKRCRITGGRAGYVNRCAECL